MQHMDADAYAEWKRGLVVSALAREGISAPVGKLLGFGVSQRRRIVLTADVPDGLPPLRADRRMLAQVLLNLLSNAVKFTAAGGNVRLAAWCRPDTGCVFQVSDTGKGIALKDIPLALAPFGQVPDAARRPQGTGLGLPLSKALVELHAGSLDLQSEPGIGTTVTVRLPAERVRAMPKVA